MSRRNLAQRIERFLCEQEAMPTPTLTGWQADQVLAAIELLEAGRFAEAEHVITKAERPDLWTPRATFHPTCRTCRSCSFGCSRCWQIADSVPRERRRKGWT